MYTPSMGCSQHRSVPNSYSPTTRWVLELLVNQESQCLLLLSCLNRVYQCRPLSVVRLWGILQEPQPSVISRTPFPENLKVLVWSRGALNHLCTSVGFTDVYVNVCVCVYTCSLGESVCDSHGAHTAVGPVQRFSCFSPPLRSRLVAPFPGSSHLPTLLLFVAFQNWEKQGSLLDPQQTHSDRLFFSRRR